MPFGAGEALAAAGALTFGGASPKPWARQSGAGADGILPKGLGLLFCMDCIDSIEYMVYSNVYFGVDSFFLLG